MMVSRAIVAGFTPSQNDKSVSSAVVMLRVRNEDQDRSSRARTTTVQGMRAVLGASDGQWSVLAHHKINKTRKRLPAIPRVAVL